MKKHTNYEKSQGELAARNLSEKAQKLYDNTDPMTIYANNDGSFSVESCLFNDDFNTFEAMEKCFEEVYDEIAR